MDTHSSMILTLAFWVLIGAACSYFAYQRGRDPYAWFAIGIFLGFFGLILLMLLPAITKEGEEERKTPSLSDFFMPADSASPVPPLPPVPVQDDLTKTWHCIDKEHQQQGPMGYAQLLDLWNSEKIDSNSFVWTEGMSEWKKIADLESLQTNLKNQVSV